MKLFDTRLNQEDHPLSLDEVPITLRRSHRTVSMGGDRLDAEFIASLPETIRLIACISGGYRAC
ncbi:MAG: hypothetical protein CM1200mP18_09780 [Gammaproteobacteria bacterium]|nr:MAG: hypothetical protein CM1200mP18_09780 [Gammaproteobacteria bacterium]